MESSPRPWKPTAAQLEAAKAKRLPDIVAPGLRVLFVGINPSLYSAAVGHNFARPGNRFWPALHRGGFTPSQLSPFEDRSLAAYGLGLTNIVARPTARADELDDDELRLGARLLVKKVEALAPAWVAFVGISAYRVAFARTKAQMGEQDERIGDARVWVLPNPSGLNAHYQLPRLATMFAQLRERAMPETPPS